MNELAQECIEDIDIMMMKRDLIKVVNIVWKNKSIGPEDVAILYSDAFMDLKAEIVKRVETISKIHHLSSKDKLALATESLRLIIDNNFEKLVRLVMYEIHVDPSQHAHIIMIVRTIIKYVMTDDALKNTIEGIVALANSIHKQKFFKRVRKLTRSLCCR